MSYDKTTFRVYAENEGVVKELKSLIEELHDPEKFIVRVINEELSPGSSSVDGSKILTVEVHEYVGEIPLFTAKVRETIDGAEIKDSDFERGGSEVEDAN